MIAIALAAALASFHGCPLRGDSHIARVQQLDLLKNRTTAPPASAYDAKATLPAILAPGGDRLRWRDSEAATVTGYVVLVKAGGLESVNCHAKALKYRDTHIEIGVVPDAGPRAVMVAEVTPLWRARMKAKGTDWSTRALEKLVGQKVRISGWLLLDVEHLNAAANTAPRNRRDWRGTSWELHPVVSISVAH